MEEKENVIWREMEGEGKDKREWRLRMIRERVLGRRVRIERTVEKRGKRER